MLLIQSCSVSKFIEFLLYQKECAELKGRRQPYSLCWLKDMGLAASSFLGWGKLSCKGKICYTSHITEIIHCKRYKQSQVFNCRNVTKITENKSHWSRSLKTNLRLMSLIKFLFFHWQDDQVPVALQCAKHSTAQVATTTLVFPTDFFLIEWLVQNSNLVRAKKKLWKRKTAFSYSLLVAHSHVSMHKTAV